MNKDMFGMFIIGLLALASLASPLYGEDAKEIEMTRSEYGLKDGGEWRNKGMHHQMMMKMMMEKSVTATSDGGIVIVSGKKISKYDQDLNLVKEADIKIDMDAMAKDMKEMKEKCALMEKASN